LGAERISSVVQTNSGTAEASAAASEKLNGQTLKIKSHVGKFKLRNQNQNLQSESQQLEFENIISDSKN
jgi:methyl-accepting chemotaxis protein